MRDLGILFLMYIGVYGGVTMAIVLPIAAIGINGVTNFQFYAARFIAVWAISIGAYIYAIKRNRPGMRRIMRMFFILLAVWFIGDWAVAIYFAYFGG